MKGSSGWLREAANEPPADHFRLTTPVLTVSPILKTGRAGQGVLATTISFIALTNCRHSPSHTAEPVPDQAVFVMGDKERFIESLLLREKNFPSQLYCNFMALPAT